MIKNLKPQIEAEITKQLAIIDWCKVASNIMSSSYLEDKPKKELHMLQSLADPSSYLTMRNLGETDKAAMLEAYSIIKEILDGCLDKAVKSNIHQLELIFEN